MIEHIISFDAWLSSTPGKYLLEWEQMRMDKAVEDLFGYHAIQLGQPKLDGLKNNRIPHRWLLAEQESVFDKIDQLTQEKTAATTISMSHDATAIPTEQVCINSSRQPDLVCHFSALPFPEQSIDLVVMPHTLNLVDAPHATLREVQRVLVPEGHLVITGFNPTSLWGLKQKRMYFLQRLGMHKTFLPFPPSAMIGYWRLRDWLKLLNLEIVAGHFGCYRPAFKTNKWLERCAWMEHSGDRWWPILGAAFELTAVKRVSGMRLVGRPAWKKKRLKTKGASIAAQRSPKKGSQ